MRIRISPLANDQKHIKQHTLQIASKKQHKFILATFLIVIKKKNLLVLINHTETKDTIDNIKEELAQLVEQPFYTRKVRCSSQLFLTY